MSNRSSFCLSPIEGVSPFGNEGGAELDGIVLQNIFSDKSEKNMSTGSSGEDSSRKNNDEEEEDRGEEDWNFSSEEDTDDDVESHSEESSSDNGDSSMEDDTENTEENDIEESSASISDENSEEEISDDDEDGNSNDSSKGSKAQNMYDDDANNGPCKKMKYSPANDKNETIENKSVRNKNSLQRNMAAQGIFANRDITDLTTIVSTSPRLKAVLDKNLKNWEPRFPLLVSEKKVLLHH